MAEVVQTAISSGASMHTVARKIEDAIEGVGLPKKFGSRTLDIATVTYRIRGHQLLYALSHGLGLPSLRTLRNHMAFTRIMLTLGTIRGVSVLIDEIALEEMAVHFKHANAVGRLCWKHAPLVDIVLRTYDAALNLAHGLSAGTVHLGKEMTVAAVSCFGESDAADMEFIFSTILTSWESFKDCVGSIWSVATDGDVTRRKAGYNMFIKVPLSTASELLDVASVTKLLYPNDLQDVPQAIELMQAIVAVHDLHLESNDLNTITDLDAIKLLAEVLHSILEALINKDLDLKAQVTALSKYVHLTFTLFHTHRLTSMSNHNDYVNIDSVFMRNPDLDQGQWHFNTTRVEGADHLNTKSWIGNTNSGLCNLPKA
ncbi:hypothetical protein B0H10DRAFT_2159722 [Mycena sp. CBHHK59/15]|nr:hypothetical protein B0H10DRAFT_2159722 [Mycena sp. CBHHK59/15]